VLLAVGGLGISTILLLEHHGQATAATLVDSVCGPENDSGCHIVDQSSWSEVHGVPLAALGGLFYVSIALASVLALVTQDGRVTGASVALAVSLLGLLVDAGLLALQAFVIRAYCIVCLLSYGVTVAVAIILLPAWRHLVRPATWLRLPAQRLVVVGWVMASAMAATSLGAMEWALAAGRAPANVAAEDRPVAELSLSEARAEVEHLRSVLSDPEAIESYLAQRSMRQFQANPVQDIDLQGIPLAGPANAPVQVVVYSDFLCPWCYRMAAWLGQYLPTTHGEVALAFKNYPLDRSCNPKLSRTVHEGSCHLALGGICAAAQNRFWQYHDATFEARLERATRKDAENLARKVGLDMPTFERCLDSSKARERLERDINEGRRVGVHGTPTLFVDGRQLPRARDLPAAVQLMAGRNASTRRP
jgi:protein-disulfide isomerase/uncharacterized membrane protein